MAIFENNKQNLILDDSQNISCIIETAQEVDGHIEYLLRLQRGPTKNNTWKVLRRYNDFAELHKCLRLSRIDLPLPGKKLIGNMKPDFIAERRLALQVFINTVLMNPILASSLPAKRFVDPDSYSQSFHDQAVQNASLCLRNEGVWTLGTSMGTIGWRIRKHYFKVMPKPPEKTGNKLLVKSGSQSHQSKHSSAASTSSNSVNGGSLDGGNISIDPSELVLEWIEYGPDKFLEEKDLSGILKSLLGLKHPNIETIVYAAHNENGCLVIRKFHKHGTLKDILCMSTPKNPFLSKYGNPKGRATLSMKQVAIFGRQILEALIFLHAKGYPYGHLHAGNIVIDNDNVKLLDVENYILGVPSFYRPFFVQHSKIHSSENVDVYSFGHVLFEMAMGYPLQESVVRQINDCPESLKNLLECILSKEACRAGLPTLDQLLEHQFFAQHAEASSSADYSNYHFKLSLNAKEAIKHASQKSENRLRDEQKLVKSQKRIVRVQEMMSSEEEKRKTKHKTKLDHKQAKLKQQDSLQTQVNSGKLSLLPTASGSIEAGATSFIRTDSVLNEPQNILEDKSILSPPPTPLQQKQQQQHQQKQNLSKQMSSVGSSSSVERQYSSPNVSSDEPNETNRSALLESICRFNRGSLRKVRSND